MTARSRAIAAAVIGLLTLAVAVAPLVRGVEEISTSLHHLLHTALAFGSAIAGILIAKSSRGNRPSPAFWLIIAVLAPIGAMFLMWPSEYAFFETHPGGHTLEHLGIVAFGFLAAFCGERYARGVGWAMALTLVVMAFLSAFGFGVSAPPSA